LGGSTYYDLLGDGTGSERECSYGSTAGSILCSTTGDVDDFVFIDDLIVSIFKKKKKKVREITRDENKKSYNIGRCSFAAKIASFGFKLYFLRRSSPLVT